MISSALLITSVPLVHSSRLSLLSSLNSFILVSPKRIPAPVILLLTRSTYADLPSAPMHSATLSLTIRCSLVVSAKRSTSASLEVVRPSIYALLIFCAPSVLMIAPLTVSPALSSLVDCISSAALTSSLSSSDRMDRVLIVLATHRDTDSVSAYIRSIATLTISLLDLLLLDGSITPLSACSGRFFLAISQTLDRMQGFSLAAPVSILHSIPRSSAALLSWLLLMSLNASIALLTSTINAICVINPLDCVCVCYYQWINIIYVNYWAQMDHYSCQLDPQYY